MRPREISANPFDRSTAFGQISTIASKSAAMLVAALVINGLALHPASVLAATIDDFTETAIIAFDETAPALSVFVDSGLASVMGGSRTIKLDVTAASDLANNVAFDIDTSGDGRAEYASGPTADGDLSLLYDGPTLASDLGNAVGAIEVGFLAFDDGFDLGMDVTVAVSDGMETADLTIPILGASLNPFLLVFNLNNFNGAGLVDTANLTSIEVMFEPMQGQDFALDAIHARFPVPEPAAVVLLGLGGAIMVGVYGLRRKG